MAAGRRGPRRRAAGRRIGARERGSPFLTPAGWAAATTSAAIQCADAPADQSPQAWPQVIGRLERISRLQGRVHGLVGVGPVRLLAGPRARTATGGPGTPDPEPDPADQPDATTPTRAMPTPCAPSASWVTRSCSPTRATATFSFQDPSACVEKAMVKYLVDLKIPPKDKRGKRVCQSDRKPFDPKFQSGTESPPPGQVVEQDLP